MLIISSKEKGIDVGKKFFYGQKITHYGVLIMDTEYAKKIIKAHGMSIKHVAHQCYIPVRRLYRFLNNERLLEVKQLHRLSRYLEHLESIELFRGV